MKDEALQYMGQIHDKPIQKDAVHVAVLQVECGVDYIQPGAKLVVMNKVSRKEGELWKVKESKSDEDYDGVADPFLSSYPRHGERFFMIMQPGTIDSLRHEWTHPTLTRLEEENAEYRRKHEANQLTESDIWMANYCEGFGVSVNDMLGAADEYLERGEYFSRGPTFEGFSVSQEFWNHYGVIRGTPVGKSKRGNFFSCSC